LYSWVMSLSNTPRFLEGLGLRSREKHPGGETLVMFLENCELAQRLGFGCFTWEELEEFLRYVQANYFKAPRRLGTPATVCRR